MDYINYQSPTLSEDPQELNPTTTSPNTVRTIEPNRSLNESTERRLYGAYRNNDTTERSLTPVSTPDAPLIYPLFNEYNANEARDLNRQVTSTTTNTTQGQFPLPPFTTTPSRRGDSSTIRNPYSMQPSMNIPTQPWPNAAMPNYQMSSQQGMYLPVRNTPYYNLGSGEYVNYDDYEDAERDLDYLKQFYPTVCRIIQEAVQEECDQLEYEGSAMFDEYPDKLTLERMMQRIYQRVKDNAELKPYFSATTPTQVSANQIPYYSCPSCNVVDDFIHILFINEMYHRRRRYHNRRRWFY